jgi:DNA-binding beta-propeller fold protein YncE
MGSLFRSVNLAGLLAVFGLTFGGLLFCAVAQQAPPSKESTDELTTTKITMTEWTTPERGWLYVLDGKMDPASGEGRISLVDPTEGNIVGSIHTGSNPDFAISPDGKLLFVASKADERLSDLAIIDTAKGTVVKTLRIEGRVTTDDMPSYSGMSVSADGRLLRVLTRDPRSPDADFMLDAIDIKTGTIQPNGVDLDECGFGRFIDHPSEEQFDYLCPVSNRVRQVNIDQKTGKADHETVEFPWLRRLGVAEAFLTGGGEYMAFVRGDGEVDLMNVDSANFSGTRQRYVTEGLVLPGQWPISPDGKRIYLGYALHPDPKFYMRFERSTYYPRTAGAYELSVFDAETWKHIGNMTGKWWPYWSAVISSDSKIVYALSPENGGIAVFDTTSRKETRQIELGGTPALALVAP